MGWDALDCVLFTPYPYLFETNVAYGLIGVRYIDLRSQMLETDKLIAESLDKYAFVRGRLFTTS